MEYLVFGIAGLIVYLDIVASYQLYRSNNYDRSQKIAQYIIIWLFPLLGAFLVLYFVAETPAAYGAGKKPPSRLTQLLALSFFVSYIANHQDQSSEGNGHGGIDIGNTSDGGGGDT